MWLGETCKSIFHPVNNYSSIIELYFHKWSHHAVNDPWQHSSGIQAQWCENYFNNSWSKVFFKFFFPHKFFICLVLKSQSTTATEDGNMQWVAGGGGVRIFALLIMQKVGN